METPSITVHLTTDRSSPEPAARDLGRVVVTHLPLFSKTTIYVRGPTKIYAYVISRNYNNPALRGFTFEKAGPPIPLTKLTESNVAIPRALRTQPSSC